MNTIKLENKIIKTKYNSFDELNEDDLKLLNSKKGVKYLIKQDEINMSAINKVLRQIHYELQLSELQVELIKLQKDVIKKGKRMVILFEGRDTAGKGGAIRRFMEHINPRHATEIALPKPTEGEKKSWYLQRYIKNLPEPGNIVFFNRSWYNRAIVEPVNGFCTNAEYEKFMQEVIDFENMLIKDDIHLIKFYFSISKSEQQERLELIKNNPLKLWKVSNVDKRAIELWDKYSEYKNKMFEQTATKNNPWVILNSNSKMSARINAINYVLSKIDYDKNQDS
ncbi:UDP-galactose-lipid carrier transferase (EC [uncultured Gammaproteobacteria bacterium]|jgi:polyphosphate kinase 2|nr:Polyphosphate kinase 2 (EC 2.7.4.1) [uncultured Gammaproteobacteria bacterium]VVH61011.1 UDP-galactose-lipid carrier transferase (EC [uncultured Gammaproteobacteria bacterium]